MKKFTLYILTAFGLMGLATSCNDFGDVNNDPMNLNPGVVDYKMEFTQVEAQICGSDWDVWRNGCIYTANMIQHTASVDWAYGVFYTWNDQYSGAYWGGFYSGGRAAIRNIIDVMNNWEGNPAYANEYQMCRILKAYMFQNMTDLYGDVPYSEAGQGYSTNPIPYPKYDTQEAIYNDLLKELDEAQAALSTSAGNTIGAADVIYNGDAAKWKKFANSLMLRVAMRFQGSHEKSQRLSLAAGEEADSGGEAVFQSKAQAGNHFTEFFMVAGRKGPAQTAAFASSGSDNPVFLHLHAGSGAFQRILENAADILGPFM